MPTKQLQWCRIGDENNPPLPDGRGTVAYAFEIARYPVTNTQYCAFLNSLPGEESAKYYARGMSDHFFGGIIKDPEAKDKYRPKEGFENKPVVLVSWHDAQGFCQWLTGHDSAWRFRLPTADEWLKAAAFRGTSGWAKYVTGHDESPSQNPADPNSANYYHKRHGWALPFPHLADVDLYQHPGPYGTIGQAGNIGEWVDAAMYNGWKYALGSPLFRPVGGLLVTSAEGDAPAKRIPTFGFRLVRQRKEEGRGSIAQSAETPETTAATPRNTAAEYVVVGCPRNKPDAVFGQYGRVDYYFEIAKHAVTNRDYAAFLNAAARLSDPFALFHKDMESGVLGGIVRTGQEGAWQYQAKAGWELKPVVYVDYFNAARYANWLHYGSPDTGCSQLGTTEGDTRQGAYDTRHFSAYLEGDRRKVRQIGRRNAGARYWIPSNDEWYKAAYYDPEKPGPYKYWEYPTRSSDLPDNSDATKSNAANYQPHDTFAQGQPYYLADVGEYARAASFFGAVQMGGNVWEWLEDFRYGRGDIQCGLRGGSFGYTETGLSASNEDLVGIDTRAYIFGMRMARAVDESGWQPLPRHYHWRVKAAKLLFRIALKL